MMFALCVLPGVLLLTTSAPADPWKLEKGDRVALIGSGLIEQERSHGYLETALTRHFPDSTVSFRNLGWSGDTVRGSARTGGFQSPDGFARLLQDLQNLKPTVIFIGYGTNESYAGPEGLPDFLQGFATLLDRLAPLKARIVVLSPIVHEDLGRPYPDPAGHNQNLERYTAALEKLAARRGLRFVDLFHRLSRQKSADPRHHLTSNGILPNESGYRTIAAEVEGCLLGNVKNWHVTVDSAGKVFGRDGARVESIKTTPDGLQFKLAPARLPGPAPHDTPLQALPVLSVKGLAPGRYVLRIDGAVAARATAAEWATGVRLEVDPSRDQAEKFRAAVVQKDALYARRWRPFNDFAEHWGYIGGDFKLYDARIAKQEAVIDRLRRPAPLRCMLSGDRGAE